MKLQEASILIVDDEPDLREIFAAWLGRLGCTVLTAANGLLALDVLKREKVDVLVSDIRMPIMSGIELVRQVYSENLLIPSIIFVSGFGDVEPREMYGLGVEVLLEKPLGRNQLLNALEASLAVRDDLWLTPPPAPIAQNIALELPSLEEAAASCEFQIGRGGCSFVSKSPPEVDLPVALSVHFNRENVMLKAQGTVRWVASEDGRAGVSFDYLDHQCRQWVLDIMHRESFRSFIPQCRILTAP